MRGPLRVEWGEYVEDGEEWKKSDSAVAVTRYFCGDVEISEEEYEEECERRADRDRFAGFALEGLLSTCGDARTAATDRVEIARASWKLADEMLKQRGY